MSLPILEAEARLRPVELRLRLRTLKHVIYLHTLPGSHLFWKCRNRVAKQRKRFLLPLARFHQEFRPELGKNHQQPIETIFAYTVSLFQPNTQYQVTITVARALAKKEAETFDNKTTYFTNGSERNERVGAAVIQQNQHGTTMTSDILSSYVAELYGILMVVQKIRQTCHTKIEAR